MPIDYDEIRKEVAIRHSILLDASDPILVTVTLNDIVLSRYVEILTAKNEENQRALAVALAVHTEQAKEQAGRVITDAAHFVSDQVRQAISSAVAEAGDQLRRDIAAAQSARHEASAGAEVVRSAKNTVIIATVVCCICAAFVAIIAMTMAMA